LTAKDLDTGNTKSATFDLWNNNLNPKLENKKEGVQIWTKELQERAQFEKLLQEMKKKIDSDITLADKPQEKAKIKDAFLIIERWLKLSKSETENL
jgi:hypothetical protein